MLLFVFRLRAVGVVEMNVRVLLPDIHLAEYDTRPPQTRPDFENFLRFRDLGKKWLQRVIFHEGCVVALLLPEHPRSLIRLQGKPRRYQANGLDHIFSKWRSEKQLFALRYSFRVVSHRASQPVQGRFQHMRSDFSMVMNG